MVWARLVAVLAVACVGVREASGLTLEGVRTPHGPPHSPLHPHLAPRDDLIPDEQALALMADPPALRYEEAELLEELENPHSAASYRLQNLISELAEAAAAGDTFEGVSEVGPLPADAVTEVEAAGVMAAGRTGDTWETPDPRYRMLINDYLSRVGGEASSSNRNARDSRNSRSINNHNHNHNHNNNNSLTSSSATTGTTTTADNHDNNPSHMATTTTNTNNMFKRAWPHNFSRRRSSGLSLSIDASMKVLREALYLEIARKKQRQQILRAQHNKALLSDIGKRDVASQLLEAEHTHGAALDNGRN